jgi:hypothetical protein
MTFGDGKGIFKGISSVRQSGAHELIKTSIDHGVNFFDTADNYAEGESEKIRGQSLKKLNIARHDVVIATKVYSRVGPGRNDVGAFRGRIMNGVEAVSAVCRPTMSTRTRSTANGAAGEGPLHRLFQLASMEDRQRAWYLGIQEPGQVRDASCLLLDRRTRSRTGNRSPVGIRKGWPARLEFARRWLALWQVQPDAAEARRIRAALTTTFLSWTKSGPGRSSTRWLRSPKHMDVVPHVSRSHGS